MKVENINQNYVNVRNLGSNKNARVNTQFTGAAITPKIINYLPAQKAIEKMNSIKWLKGELGGILITAFGTGLVAPIFIAFNPFVKAGKDATPEQKEDIENTKKYTAWRQPISAVLAGIFQAGALGPIDRFMEKLTNDPEYAKDWWITLDQSALNKRSYIERVIAKEMKKENVSYPDKKAFKEELARRADTREAEQIKKVSDKLMETGQIYIGERTVDKDTLIELIDEKVKSYIKDAESLQISKKGLDFYSQRAKTLIENEKTIRDLFTNIPKGDTEALTDYLKKALNETEKPEVKELIQEVLDHKENIRESRCERTIERIGKIKEACGGTYSEKAYLESLKEKNRILSEIASDLKTSLIGENRNIDEGGIIRKIEEIVKKCHFDESNPKLKNILHGSGTFRPDMADIREKVYADIVKGYKQLVEEKFKGFSQISKIAIGVCITLPITCTALNWVYPRFMELCFPKLAGVKKAKPEGAEENGGDK